MTTFLLIRHGAHELGPSVLPARTPGVHLSSEGVRQAEAVAERTAHLPISAIYASPLDRAEETARPLATRLGLQVRTSAGIHEIDFGEWTGRTIADLEPAPPWRRWNTFRSNARPPGGERMLEIQARFVAELERMRDNHGDGVVAIFSHGDPIRAVLAHALGVHLDLCLRIEVSLASVSVLELGEHGPLVRRVNDTGRIELG